MGLFDRLADYIYSGSSQTEEDIATARQVAAGQQAILDRQAREGRVGYLEYAQMSAEIDNSDEIISDYRDKKDDFVRVLPWWAWVLIGLGVFGVFLYFGGWTLLAPKVKKLFKKKK